MKKLIILALLLVSLSSCNNNDKVATNNEIDTFEKCIEQKGEVVNTDPKQCIYDGVIFLENADVKDIEEFREEFASKCDDKYDPVCGEMEVQCIKAPCENIKSTFDNECKAKESKAKNIKEGACEYNNKDKCINLNGNWIEDAQECENISKSECEETMNGKFNECASACRNDPKAEMCTMQCVLVCELDPKKIADEYEVDSSDIINNDELIKEIKLESTLNEKEIEGIKLMREEEKLARDVYTKLFEKWQVNVFYNISLSEQSHMDAMGALIKKYNLDDPIKDDAIGEFTSEALKSFYDKFVEDGNRSLLSALKIGAKIEDLDINDLDKLIKETKNQDILVTYKNLQKSSRNHLRAFVRQIEKNNGIYIPEFISESNYKAIISGSQERGRVR